MPRLSGTLTFLFTDIEGSTRRWELDREGMRSALAVHDEVLRSAIGAHGGRLFKHTGDGVCAAFGSARAAIEAAVEAQRRLGLPVRMGLASGEVDERDGDYFGPALNRAARVMAAGHGGQILVAASTASLVDGVELVDLGEHRLRDLSGATRLFQVRAAGLAVEFPPLRTMDAVPGNLPVQVTSFVGREVAVKELAEQVRAHRLVTLTGVGGVGKTRLAVQAAAELAAEFPDGVWLVELAPVGDPAAVPDVVATVLGVRPQAGFTVTDSVVQALSGRRLLMVVDNCEHVLGSAGDLVESIVVRTATVTVLATSREGLRVPAEQLWPVPPLDVAGGVDSAAVQLFVDRGRAVQPGFSPDTADEAEAVAEICRRVDGIALAIELAAARMVSMSPKDVCDHLDDRFRLLSGSRRGLERHQTLRNMVQWSYDLLDNDERMVLGCCSVFAGGFDLAAATHLCGGGLDEYAVLDRLDSLVRKSMLTAERVSGHGRYGMLETIRHFAQEQLAATGTISINELRDRHAHYFADQAVARWATWEGPGYRLAVEWVDTELANLRTGFRWATDHADLVTATAIAAHSTTLGFLLQLFEPIGWAEEILPAATTAGLAQLPRLYSAAGMCGYVGRFEAAIAYGQTALKLLADPRYESFDPGWVRFWAAVSYVISGGDPNRWLETCAELALESGLARIVGLDGLLYMLPVVGRVEEARAMAAETLRVASGHGNPAWIAMALIGTGRAFADSDSELALDAFRQAFLLTREQRIPWFEARVAREAASLEAKHGDLREGLEYFDAAIDAYHRAGNQADLAAVLAELAVFFDQNAEADTAATVYGTSRHYTNANWVINLSATVEHLRAVLGNTVFDEFVATGAEMTASDAIRYVRQKIQDTRAELAARS